MASLQRSAETFRREGSSGLVWQEQFFSEDLRRMKKSEEGVDPRQMRASQSVGTIGMMERGRRPMENQMMERTQGHMQNQMMERSQLNVGKGKEAFRAGHVAPDQDPPSPKVSGCCGLFGKPAPAKGSKKKRR